MFVDKLPMLIIILVIAVFIFGPKKLPEIGEALGKGMREFKKSMEDIKKDVETTAGLDEKSRSDLKSALSMEPTKEEAPKEVVK